MLRITIAGILALLHLTAASHAADRPVPGGSFDRASFVDDKAQVFDEVRFGALTSIDEANEDSGKFVTGMVLFDPWGHNEAFGWDRILRPRVHIGGTIATDDKPNQVFAGLSWTAHLTEKFFLELGLGGTFHDGHLDVGDNDDGPFLGCRALFREYMAAGLNLTENWSLIAHMEHSSHANLCDGPNEGLSRAGVMLGYAF